MNAEYIKDKSMYQCKKCKKLHANYRWASDCCLPRIKLINHMTGEEVNIAFGVKRLGYSNEYVVVMLLDMMKAKCLIQTILKHGK